jgi:hypothetical protein
MKFIIYSPPLDYKVGGTIVLHQLAKDLNEMGQQAMLYIPGEVPCQNPFCNRFATLSDVDDGAIVVYPEIIAGNPLNAKHAVHWMLCDLGVHSRADIYKTWRAEDLIFHYSTFNNQYDVHQIEVLYTTWIDPEVKNKNLVKSGSCYLFKKACSFHKEIQMIHPADALLIDNFSNAKIIEIFHQKKYFYCYDPYSFYDVMAALCGCIPIIYPIDGVSRGEWLKTRAAFSHKERISGFAYGLSDLEFAEKTILDTEDDLRGEREYEKCTVRKFIEIAKSHFLKQKSAKNTVSEIAKVLHWGRLNEKSMAFFEISEKKLLEQIRQKDHELDFMRSSKFWKLRQFLMR